MSTIDPPRLPIRITVHPKSTLHRGILDDLRWNWLLAAPPDDEWQRNLRGPGAKMPQVRKGSNSCT